MDCKREDHYTHNDFTTEFVTMICRSNVRNENHLQLFLYQDVRFVSELNIGMKKLSNTYVLASCYSFYVSDLTIGSIIYITYN